MSVTARSKSWAVGLRGHSLAGIAGRIRPGGGGPGWRVGLGVCVGEGEGLSLG